MLSIQDYSDPNMCPKKLRDLTRSRQEILDIAFYEVFTRGFQGVSIDDIVRKTSMTKGAFYHHFPTKLDMGYALVEETIQGLILSRWIDPLKKYENPIEGVLERLRILIGEAPLSDLEFGCPLNNLIQEMAPIDRRFRDTLKKALELWIDGMRIELERGKKSGHVRRSVDTKEAAVFIIMAHEGFYGMIKSLGNKNQETFKILHSSLKRYLDLLATDSR